MNREQFWQHLETWHGELEAFCHKLSGSRDDGADVTVTTDADGKRQIQINPDGDAGDKTGTLKTSKLHRCDYRALAQAGVFLCCDVNFSVILLD